MVKVKIYNDCHNKAAKILKKIFTKYRFYGLKLISLNDIEEEIIDLKRASSCKYCLDKSKCQNRHIRFHSKITTYLEFK